MKITSAFEKNKPIISAQIREGLTWAKDNLPGPIVAVAFFAALPTLGAKTIDTLSAYQQLLANPTPIVRGIESFDVSDAFPNTKQLIEDLLRLARNDDGSTTQSDPKNPEKVARPEKVATTEDLYSGHKLCVDTGPKAEDQLAAITYSCGGITIAGLGTSYEVGQFGTGVNEVINKDLYDEVMNSASQLGVKNIIIKYLGHLEISNDTWVQQKGETRWNSATKTLTINMSEVGGPEIQPDGKRAWGLTVASNLVLRASLDALRAADLDKSGEDNDAKINWQKHLGDIPDDYFGPYPEDGLIFGLHAHQIKLD